MVWSRVVVICEVRLAVLLRLGSTVASLHSIIWYILAYPGLGIDHTLSNSKKQPLSEISRSIKCCTIKDMYILTAPFLGRSDVRGDVIDMFREDGARAPVRIA